MTPDTTLDRDSIFTLWQATERDIRKTEGDLKSWTLNYVKADKEGGLLEAHYEHDAECFLVDMVYRIAGHSKDFTTVQLTGWARIQVRRDCELIPLFRWEMPQESVTPPQVFDKTQEMFKHITAFIEHNFPGFIYDGPCAIPVELAHVIPINVKVHTSGDRQRAILEDSVEDITKAFDAVLHNTEIVVRRTNRITLTGRGHFELPDNSEWEFETHLEVRPDLGEGTVVDILTTTVKMGDHFQQDIWTKRNQVLDPFDKDSVVRLVSGELDKVMTEIAWEVEHYGKV